MILAIGAGFGLRALTDLREGPWIGALVGLVAAQWVPGRRASCAAPAQPDTADRASD